MLKNSFVFIQLPKTSLTGLGVRLKMHELTVSSETFESECKLCLISNAILGGKKNRPRQPLKANLFFSYHYKELKIPKRYDTTDTTH